MARKSYRLGEVINKDNKYKRQLRDRYYKLRDAVQRAIKKYPDLEEELEVPLRETGYAVHGLAYGSEICIISPQCAEEIVECEEDE